MNYFLSIVACLIVMIPAFYLTREKFRKKEENVAEASSEELVKVEEPVKKLDLKKLLEKNEEVYVLYMGLPYHAYASGYFSGRIKLNPVDWLGNYVAGSNFHFEDMEKDLTLFTPVKEVLREETEEDSPDRMVLHKVSAKIRSKYNKTYKIEFDVEVNKHYTEKVLPDFKKEIVGIEVNVYRADPTSDRMILQSLREIKGISLLREDIKEIEFKKFERPAKIKKTIVTYG